MKIMTFHLSDDVYAVELAAISAVARERESTGGSGSEELPLVDLRERLGFDGGGESGAVLVLRDGGRGARVRVDRPGEVLEVGDFELREVPRFFGSTLLRGVLVREEGIVVLLDGGALLEEAHGTLSSPAKPASGEEGV